jgi:hypothetical protein
MKKIAIPIIFGLSVVFIAIGLSGCVGENEEEISDSERFIGTWTEDGIELWYELSDIAEITFDKNNTFTTDTDISGTYEFKNEKLVLTLYDDLREISFTYQFSIDYEKVTLIDPNGRAASYVKN